MQPMRDMHSYSSETASHVPEALYIFLWVQSKQSFNTETAPLAVLCWPYVSFLCF